MEIIKIVVASIGGIITGFAVKDVISATGSQYSAQPVFYPDAVSGGISPWMVVSIAILALCLSYAVKSIVSTLRSWNASDNRPNPNYYE